MEMVKKNFQMEISIKVNMQMVSQKAKVNISGLMEVIIKANLKMVYVMDKVIIYDLKKLIIFKKILTN